MLVYNYLILTIDTNYLQGLKLIVLYLAHNKPTKTYEI